MNKNRAIIVGVFVHDKLTMAALTDSFRFLQKSKTNPQAPNESKQIFDMLWPASSLYVPT